MVKTSPAELLTLMVTQYPVCPAPMGGLIRSSARYNYTMSASRHYSQTPVTAIIPVGVGSPCPGVGLGKYMCDAQHAKYN